MMVIISSAVPKVMLNNLVRKQAACQVGRGGEWGGEGRGIDIVDALTQLSLIIL